MKAIVVDPYARTVTEIDHTGELQAMYEAIGGPETNPTACHTICRASLGADIDGWLDDEGNWNQEAWFRLKPTNGSEPVPVLYCGRMLMLSHNSEGDSAGLPDWVSPKIVEATVEWLDDDEALEWARECDRQSAERAKEYEGRDDIVYIAHTHVAAAVSEVIDNKRRRAAREAEEEDSGCINPEGHEWNQTAGEADEARLSGDYANDRIYCIHCGADGDA